MLPGARHLAVIAGPVDLRQTFKECVLGLLERQEREFSGCLVHQSRVVPKVPALHDGADAEFPHCAILAVEAARNGHEGMVAFSCEQPTWIFAAARARR